MNYMSKYNHIAKLFFFASIVTLVSCSRGEATSTEAEAKLQAQKSKRLK